MAICVPTRISRFAVRSNPGVLNSGFRLSADAPRSPGHRPQPSRLRRYRPGDTVRASGIFQVVHERAHRDTHEVVMISGEKFPDCDTCKDRVRFQLVRTAPYIFQDEDFEENP